MFIPHHYENPHTLRENTRPDRAYFVPASREMEDLEEHRERSDRLRLLNGLWRFRYFPGVRDLQERFYEPGAALEGFPCLEPGR